MLVKHIKQLSQDLQEKAAKVNGAEQEQRPQRAVRQSQGSPGNPARSLSQLTGEPAIFAHIHLSFSWMLSCKIAVEHPRYGPPLPKNCSPTLLRHLAHEMDEDCFRKACYCTLTGIGIETEVSEILTAFYELLPGKWPFPSSGERCRLVNINGKWEARWLGCLPSRLPTLQTASEKALKDEHMLDDTLKYYLTSLIMHWLHTARSLVWTPTQDQKLLQSLGVQKYDLPLLAYWMTHCIQKST